MKTAKYTVLVLILACAGNLPCGVQAQRAASEMMATGQLKLMPVPASVQMQAGRLPITSSFNVMVKSYGDDLACLGDWQDEQFLVFPPIPRPMKARRL
jgi:hypothetical protein